MSWVAQRRPDAQTAPSARWLMFGHSVTWGENSHGQAGSSGFSGLSQSANLGQSSRGPQAGGNGGGICVSTFRPGLWAASSLCVFCGLSSRSGSPSWWLSGLTFRDPSSKSVWPSGPPGPHLPSAVCVRPSVFNGLVTHVPDVSPTPTEDPAGFTPSALDSASGPSEGRHAHRWTGGRGSPKSRL